MMIEALLAAGRVLLASVFAVAAIAKILDREGTRAALRDFGAPMAIAGLLTLALPVAELAVAGLLLPAATVVAGAAGALVLLALFSLAIGLSLVHGRRPDCHCFGALHSAPAGPAALVRNGLLGVVAVLALVGSQAEPGTGLLDWAEGLSASQGLAAGLGLTVITGLAGFITLLRSYGTVLVRVERLEAALSEAGYELDEIERLGLEPGTPAPAFALSEAREPGREVGLEELLDPSLPLLLVFTSPGCGPCEALMPDLAGWQEAHSDRIAVAVLGRGEPGELRTDAERHRLRTVLADRADEVSGAFGAHGTPSAVLVNPDATVGSHVAAGPAAIAELVAGLLAAGPPIGSPAPRLDHLVALDEQCTELTGHGESLVLFWNPGCGFCREMHADLLAWETDANGFSPRLLVISSGTEEATRAEGFSAPVLLDPDSSAAGAFGAHGTPSAVVVDAEGRMASEVLVGAETILGRARGPQLVQVGVRE